MTIKNKFFATSATAALVVSAIVPVASAAQFNDADQIPSWAQEAVEVLVNKEVLQGNENNEFNPKGIVSRAEAAEMLYKALKLPAEGTEDFSDVEEKNWFYKAVVATSQADIFEGNEKGEFKPGDVLTREQAAAVLVRAFDLTGEADLSKYPDADKVSKWAKSYVEIAVANGVMKGNGTSLNPDGDISRSEMAVMLNRVLKDTSTPIIEDVTIKSLGEAVSYKVNPVTQQLSVLVDTTKLPEDLQDQELVLVMDGQEYNFKVNQFKPTQIEVANTNYTEAQLENAIVKVAEAVQQGILVSELGDAVSTKVNPVTQQLSLLVDTTKLPEGLQDQELVLVMDGQEYNFKVNQFKTTQIEVANTNYTEAQLKAAVVKVK